MVIGWTFDDGYTGAEGSGDALSTTGNVTVNIRPVNDDPQTVNPPPAQTVMICTAIQYTLPANTFTDPGGNPLTYSIVMACGTGVPPWLSFNPATRTFSGIPAAGDADTLNIRITARDPANASSQTLLTITVKAVSATTTTLTSSSPNPQFGDSVLLTATVTGTAPPAPSSSRTARQSSAPGRWRAARPPSPPAA